MKGSITVHLLGELLPAVSWLDLGNMTYFEDKNVPHAIVFGNPTGLQGLIHGAADRLRNEVIFATSEAVPVSIDLHESSRHVQMPRLLFRNLPADAADHWLDGPFESHSDIVEFVRKSSETPVLGTVNGQTLKRYKDVS
jgi:hypothetical protein